MKTKHLTSPFDLNCWAMNRRKKANICIINSGFGNSYIVCS